MHPSRSALVGILAVAIAAAATLAVVRRAVSARGTPVSESWSLETSGSSEGLLEHLEEAEYPRAMRVSISRIDAGAPQWHVKLQQQSYEIEEGTRYRVRLKARAGEPRPIGCAVGNNHQPWDGLGAYHELAVTTEWTTFECLFVASSGDTDARLFFDLAANDSWVELADVVLRDDTHGSIVWPTHVAPPATADVADATPATAPDAGDGSGAPGAGLRWEWSQWRVPTGPDEPDLAGSLGTASIPTSLYDTELVLYMDLLDATVFGGAIAPLGPGILVASGGGDLYYFEQRDASERPDFVRLRQSIPINSDAFAEEYPAEYSQARFRVSDILIQELGGRIKLFASHHFWNADDRCAVVRVSELETTAEALVGGSSDDRWETVYETHPCLVLAGLFQGHMSGGALAQIDSETLLLSVGDHDLETPAQDLTSDYGKTVRIDVGSRQGRVFSSGHRNPQGLLSAADGRLWLTEHGPRGGDELNLVVESANYGWPLVTYGTNYGALTWPLSSHQGSHEGYRRPTYAWVPSIGVTSLLDVRGGPFALWDGDLLVTSLAGQTLFRLRVRDDAVVFAEPVYLAHHVRDITQDAEGRVALFVGGDALGFLAPVQRDGAAEAAAADTPGAILFRACRECHEIGNGFRHGRGPDLGGLEGSDIASASGFDYSESLRAVTGTWTRESLDLFLTEPEGFAPGTTMDTGGIGDPTTRADLIEFLLSNR